MKPVKRAIEHMRQSQSIHVEKTGMREIDDLFEFLSERDRENEEKLHRAEVERQTAVEQQQKAAAEIEIIQEIYGNDITPEQYVAFNIRLHTLTSKEREVYDLYLQGKKAHEIAVLLDILKIRLNSIIKISMTNCVLTHARSFYATQDTRTAKKENDNPLRTAMRYHLINNLQNK